MSKGKIAVIVIVLLAIAIGGTLMLRGSFITENDYTPKYIQKIDILSLTNQDITKSAIEYCVSVTKDFSKEQIDSEVKRLGNVIQGDNVNERNMRMLLLKKLEYGVLLIVANEKYNRFDKYELNVLLKVETYKSLSVYWNDLFLAAHAIGGEHNLRLAKIYVTEGLWCTNTQISILLKGIDDIKTKKPKFQI